MDQTATKNQLGQLDVRYSSYYSTNIDLCPVCLRKLSKAIGFKVKDWI